MNVELWFLIPLQAFNFHWPKLVNATKQPIQALSSVYLSLGCSFIWILFSSTGRRHSWTTQGLLRTRMFWCSNYGPAQVSLQYWDPWVEVRMTTITHAWYYKLVIPVLFPFEDFGRNGISCRLVNKSTLRNQSMIKSPKSVNDSRHVV